MATVDDRFRRARQQAALEYPRTADRASWDPEAGAILDELAMLRANSPDVERVITAVDLDAVSIVADPLPGCAITVIHNPADCPPWTHTLSGSDDLKPLPDWDHDDPATRAAVLAFRPDCPS